jgi:hypothetical protein
LYLKNKIRRKEKEISAKQEKNDSTGNITIKVVYMKYHDQSGLYEISRSKWFISIFSGNHKTDIHEELFHQSYPKIIKS